MKRESFDHGFPEAVWEAGWAEAREAMIAVAARRNLIAYSDLVAEIRSLDLDPQGMHLAHMLGEISTAEHEAGRGMLTVVVVHKHGDQMPGPGFFRLARSLGQDTRDREVFWIGELEKVYRAWSVGRGVGRMSRGLPAFAALFSDEQRRRICEAPMFSGQRHPLWVPLFGEETSLHAGHYRLEQSVKLIAVQPDGLSWLKAMAAKLLDQRDVNNASAAMAEIRAFGGLIEAGFDVQPLPETDETTPDFIAKTAHQAVAVEVAAKLQDHRQDDLQGSIYDAMRGDGPVPEGVGHSVHRRHGRSIQMFVSAHQPGGSPDPSKPHDSVQANLISRVCGIKGKEHQIPEDMAAVLVVDFNDFGTPLTAVYADRSDRPGDRRQ